MGLLLILVSLVALNGRLAFPGFFAMLPVAGTCLILAGDARSTWVERVLSRRPLVMIGRWSYSLYLWHWPVFCMVDYGWYAATPMLRLALKLPTTIAATLACYYFVERPARELLNRPERRTLSVAFVGATLAILIPLGVFTKREAFVDPAEDDVRAGGLVYNSSGTKGSIVLMGDSNGSMYGNMAREVAHEIGMKLTVISVAAGDPLPPTREPRQAKLWQDSLKVVRDVRPDVLIFVCNWRRHLREDQGRVTKAIEQLRGSASRIILFTQPPVLPPSASRAAIRDGSRAPFFEDAAGRAYRLEMNSVLRRLATEQVVLLDVQPVFFEENGAIRISDHEGRSLYQDQGHLSTFGANMIKTKLLAALLQ